MKSDKEKQSNDKTYVHEIGFTLYVEVITKTPRHDHIPEEVLASALGKSLLAGKKWESECYKTTCYDKDGNSKVLQVGEER